MAEVSIPIGTAGSVGDGIGTHQLLPAKSGYYYKITSVYLDYNNNGAYVLDASSRTFTITVTGSSTLINMGTYSRTANGIRPTISWTGSVNSAVGAAVNWVVTRNNNTDAGIKNQYFVHVTYTEVANTTACTAPTSVSLSATKILTGNTVTVSWSGAKAGTNNSISGYQIYSGSTLHKTVGVVSSTTVDCANWGAGSSTITVRTLGSAGLNSGSSPGVTLTRYAPCSGSVTVNKCMQTGNATLNLSKTNSSNDTVQSLKIIYRDSSNGSSWGEWYTLANGVTASSYSAATPSVGNYRQYNVHIITNAGFEINGSGYPVVYRWSGSWTDSTLTSGSTQIKAVHMTEIQNLVNKRRVISGLGNASYSTITAGSTKLSGWTSHVNEIRNAINAIASQSWTTISSNNCAASIVTELRNKIAAM